jgi:hypothetical protein
MSLRLPSIVIGYREARGHAIVLSSLAWVGVLIFGLIGEGDRSLFGPLKWADFVHFYTLGDVARTGDPATLFDSRALYARQISLVPASQGDGFVAVYGPQTALVFAPFTLAGYRAAGLLWMLVSLAVYGWCVWTAWSPLREVLPDRLFLVAGALAFPPVWQIALYGQTTAIVLLAFGAALWALQRGRPTLAGTALSLLSIKPQWTLVLTLVFLFAREWRLIAGAFVGLAVQGAAVTAVFGASVWTTYAAAVGRLPQVAGLLEPDASKMHSVRAITSLLPDRVDWTVWAIVAAGVVIVSVRIWRDAGLSLRMRFGALVVASALVNPHLTVYDAAVLAPAALLIGGELRTSAGEATWFWQRCYWISLALLLPTAKLLKIQATPVLLVELLFRTARNLRSAAVSEQARASLRS